MLKHFKVPTRNYLTLGKNFPSVLSNLHSTFPQEHLREKVRERVKLMKNFSAKNYLTLVN